jgi:hypothetical protein
MRVRLCARCSRRGLRPHRQYAGHRNNPNRRARVAKSGWIDASSEDPYQERVEVLAAPALPLPRTAARLARRVLLVTPPRTVSAQQAEDNFIVDCLLPGQIRKFSRQMTYLTSRRATKESARDCEIWGGKYDVKADYKAALDTWRPQADQGDPASQTYMGDIYAKGLGIEPDYAKAAQWYRRAAEQGYASAQVNLGSLYEEGLGVERNSRMAQDWYRKAGRIPDGNKKPLPQPPGNYYALIIGNKDYIYWPKLDTSQNDAIKTDEMLSRKYGFKTKVLLNAKRYDILIALNDLQKKLTENDSLLIYYVGHGQLDDKGNGYWVPVDGEKDGKANWIQNLRITDILNTISAKHVLVVADTYYSGALTLSSVARLPAGISGEDRDKQLKDMVEKRSRTALTSGSLQPMKSGSGSQSLFQRSDTKLRAIKIPTFQVCEEQRTIVL